MLQCKFISSTFTEATFVSLSFRQFKFCWWNYRLVITSPNRRMLTKHVLKNSVCCSLNGDAFCARREQLNADGLLHAAVLRLFSARRDAVQVQPSLTHQTLSGRVPATSQLFCHWISLFFGRKTTWLCFLLFCLCISPVFFLHFPGGSSVLTCLLHFGASLDLKVRTDLLLQRKWGSNRRWKGLLRGLNCGCQGRQSSMWFCKC